MSAPINDGGPAFPTKREALDPRETGWAMQDGMSLRDWFAGQAIAGLCASTPHDDAPDVKILAPWAYQQADEMLKVREQK